MLKHPPQGVFLVLALVLANQFMFPGDAGPLAAAAASGACKTVGTPYQLKVPFGLEDDIKQFIPTDNPLTVEKVELGKLLFFDPRLSRDNTISCAAATNRNWPGRTARSFRSESVTSCPPATA